MVVEQEARPVGTAGSGAAPQHQLAAALDLAADAFLAYALLARQQVSATERLRAHVQHRTRALLKSVSD